MKSKKVKTMCRIQNLISILFLVAGSLFAAPSVKVYSLDEALGEANISKPRIYVENTGTTTIDHFDYYYKFTTENNETPVIEDYYTPDAEVSLQPVGDSYLLKYHVTNVSLAPGQALPNTSGNIVGLHYNSWEPWDKTNDYSNRQSSTFGENNRISLYIDGVLIYGETVSGASGSLICEMWTSISGSLVSLIPVNTPFNSMHTLSSFKEINPGANYGSRIRGYVTAPVSGDYYFWIAGDDNSELWLSTNDRPENKVQIASVPYWTISEQWDKYPSQKSAAITLTAGQRYYIESLHKQGTGGDNLAVGWQKPGQTGTPEVIIGDVLTPFVFPNATPSLTAALVSPTQINLSWSDNCTNEDGYRVEQSVSGGAYSLIADLGPNVTSYQNTGLSAGTVYSYRVRAYNSQGYSNLSNVYMLTTQESTAGAVVLEKWTGLSADAEISSIPIDQSANTTAILTSLEEPVYNEDNFGTRVRGYITAPATGAYTFWIRGDDDCEFYLSTSTSPASASKICSVDGWTTESEWNKYTSQKSAAKTLTAGQKYYFMILHKEFNFSNNMAVGWLKPGESGTVPSQVIPGTVLSKFIAPVAPSNLIATAVSGSQINLRWSDNSDNEENFIIEQSLDGTTFSQIASKDPNTNSVSITGLMPATPYTFHVKSVNSAGSSAWSVTATATTQQTTAGAISRQVWMSITAGAGVAGIPVATTPSSEGSLPQLQEQPSAWDNFGTRVRGYLTAPSTGNYTFWVSGDDDCELWLSTSEDPANKTKIAHFATWTDPSQYDKFTTQKSSPVALTAGSRYYIEILHIDNTGSDHMAVQWSKPGESTTIPTEIIPGSVLSMFVLPAAPTGLTATTVSSTQIDLSWVDNADNETGFVIERALTGQSFAEVANVGRGVTSYASTSLSPNSQYQFRVRATNFKGNSDYSNTETMTTGAPGDQDGPDLTPQILSFALYSDVYSEVGNESVFSGGGAVGSNTLVKIGNEAKVIGNIVCGGNVELWDRARIEGNITCGGTMSYQVSAPPFIRDNVYQNTPVTNVVIPVKPPIAYGTTNIPVDFNQQMNLMPGSYDSICVPRGAVVTFTPGVYNFRKFIIDIDGTVLFNVPMDKTVDVNVETCFELRNSAKAIFPAKGYAPCVRIYTNDYDFLIGTEVKLNGILTAPHATVMIESRTVIEGAVYARNITLRPNAVFMSNFVNPNDDGDGDCVPNLTEMMLNDAPDDGEDYTLVAVPHPAMIDNSQPQDVTYDFGCKYPEITCEWTLTYPANSLTNPNIAPAFILSNKPKNSIPDFVEAGYNPVGNYMSMAVNTLKDNQLVQVALPLFAGVQPMLDYKIAWYDAENSDWVVTNASPLGSCALITDVPIRDVSAMIIVQASTDLVAYLNDGMIYSNRTNGKLRLNGIIYANNAATPGADAGDITINYLEHTTGNPGGVSRPPLVCPIINYKAGTLLINGEYKFANKITVTSIAINSPNFLTIPTYTISDAFVIVPGQTLTFSTHRNIEEFNNTKVNGDLISAVYDVNAIAFESMAFSEGVIREEGGVWSYDYFLKDHLGSTRMVLDQNGTIKQALMYQPYGAIAPVVGIGTTASDPLRDKFTTKEFDEDGDVNGAPGIQAFYFGARMYDPDLGVWQSRDPKGQFFNPYGYTLNPVIFIDPDGTTFGAFIGAVAIGAAASAGGYAIGASVTGGITANGLISSVIAGAIGGGFSYFGAGEKIADGLISAGHMGHAASFFTEAGVNMAVAATTNASTQAVLMATGYQKSFSFMQLGMSAASSFLATSMTVANRGFLTNSVDYTIEHVNGQYEDECSNYKYATGHDPMIERVPYFRTGGGAFTKDLGNTWKNSNPNLYPSKVSVYGKKGDFLPGTLFHELGHYTIGTWDNEFGYNAYGFESWLFPGRDVVSPAATSNTGEYIPRMTWRQGSPTTGGTSGKEYTNYNNYVNGSYRR